MSKPKKDEPQKFLLHLLRPIDYFVILGLIGLIGLLYIVRFSILTPIAQLNDAINDFDVPERVVPARSIQGTYHISSLWSRDQYIAPLVESSASLLFIQDGNTIVSPVYDLAEQSVVLESFDMMTGRTKWQTSISEPALIRRADDQYFVMTTGYHGQYPIIGKAEFEEAPIENGKDLSDCDWREKYYAVSTYDLNGQPRWGYSYPGIKIESMSFTDQSVFLRGTRLNGTQRLWVEVDKGTGFIKNKRCGDPVKTQPTEDNFPGERGGSFSAGDATDPEPFGCPNHTSYCVTTEGNRLRIMDKQLTRTIASIDFEGEELTSFYTNILIENDIVVVHFEDSSQIFGFRLP